jgi:hypothetical protein
VWKYAKALVELRPEVIIAQSSTVVATLLGQTLADLERAELRNSTGGT